MLFRQSLVHSLVVIVLRSGAFQRPLCKMAAAEHLGQGLVSLTRLVLVLKMITVASDEGCAILGSHVPWVSTKLHMWMEIRGAVPCFFSLLLPLRLEHVHFHIYVFFRPSRVF